MPILLRVKGYRFEFFSLDLGEPPHVHIRKDRKSAKYWLEPFIRLEFNSRFRSHELKEIERIILEHRSDFVEAWHGFFKR